MEEGQKPFTMLTFALEGSDAAAEGDDAFKKRRIVRGPRACDSCRSRKSTHYFTTISLKLIAPKSNVVVV